MPNSLHDKINLILLVPEDTPLYSIEKSGILPRLREYYQQLSDKLLSVSVVSFAPSDSKILPAPFPPRIKTLIRKRFQSYRSFYWDVVGLARNLPQGHIAIKYFGTTNFKHAKILTRKLKCTAVHELRSIEHMPESAKAINEMLLYSDKITVPSATLKKEIINVHGIPDDRIAVIPEFVNCERFKPDNMIIGHGGRLVYVGDLNVAEGNLKELLGAAYHERLRVTLIGNGKDTRKIRKRAEREHVMVSIIESVSNNELPSYLNSCEYFVLPHECHSIPASVLEAMACELCVIAVDCEATREVISDGVNGILVKPFSTAISRAIRERIEKTADTLDITRRARTTAQDYHNIDKIIDNEIKVLEESVKIRIQKETSF